MPCPVMSAAMLQDEFDAETTDIKDLHAKYDELRQVCPVARTSQYGGYWLLTRYDDIKEAASDAATFISSVKAVVPSDPRGLRRPPLNFDAPAHTPFRRALERTLKPSRLRRLEKILEARAEMEFLPILQVGQSDICQSLMARFPAWAETEWLNLDDDVAPLLADRAAKWVNAWRVQDKESVNRYSSELYQIATDLFADRQANPRDPEEDPASSLLLEVDADGNPLSEVHLIGALRQSLVVGMVAPPVIGGSIFKHLCEDVELQNKLREDLSLIPAAVEEFLRLYSPYRGFCRTVSREVELHGRVIRPGEPVTMTYSAANRDPSVFSEPDKFILNRPNIMKHLAFGRGPHRCAGMPLARVSLAQCRGIGNSMIQVAIKTALKMTSSFSLAGPVKYAMMPELGLISCPLAFVPASEYASSDTMG